MSKVREEDISASFFNAMAASAMKRQEQDDWNSVKQKLADLCYKAAQRGEFSVTIQTPPRTINYIRGKLEALGYVTNLIDPQTINVCFAGE